MRLKGGGKEELVRVIGGNFEEGAAILEAVADDQLVAIIRIAAGCLRDIGLGNIFSKGDIEALFFQPHQPFMGKLMPTTIGDRAREHQRDLDWRSFCGGGRRGVTALGGWRRRRDGCRTSAHQQRDDQEKCAKQPTTFR